MFSVIELVYCGFSFIFIMFGFPLDSEQPNRESGCFLEDSFLILSCFKRLWESFPADKRKAGGLFLENTQIDHLKWVIVASIFISHVSYMSVFSETGQKIRLLVCLDHLSNRTWFKLYFIMFGPPPVSQMPNK